MATPQQNPPQACPLCKNDFSPFSWTCEKCGLWWNSLEGVEIDARSLPPNEVEQLSEIIFLLKPRFHWIFIPTVFIFGAACIITIYFPLKNFLEGYAHLSTWIYLLPIMFLGYFGVLMLMAVLRKLAEYFAPSRLEDRDGKCHFNLWRGAKWSAPFQRTKVDVPFADLLGCSLDAGQGGWERDTHLFIKHASGLRIGTGWSGKRDTAQKIGSRLQAWLKHTGRSS